MRAIAAETATPLWQIFFSTLGGTLVGFFLSLFATALRERPGLLVSLHDPKERVYVVENRRPSGDWSYTVVTPAQAEEVVLTVQLVITNSSAAYDAVTNVSLEVGGVRLPARSRADATFEGVNIPPRQAVSQRVRFFIPKPGIPSRDNVPITSPDWLWQEDSSFPDLILHWSSVRRRFPFRNRIEGSLTVAGEWMTLHVPGTDIGYLHSRR